MSESKDEPLMDANQAAEYLAKRWGLESYSIQAFKQLRMRKGIRPDLAARRATFWRKSTLDKIEKPDRSQPRGKRKEHTDGDDMTNPSVVLSSLSCVVPSYDAYFTRVG